MTQNRKATGVLARLRQWARAVKQDVLALYIAARDPRVPWHVKLAAAAIAAYALSPIDPIPDFIPVLGYLDELIVLPVAIFFVIKMIPDPLMAEFRAEAQRRAERPVSQGPGRERHGREQAGPQGHQMSRAALIGGTLAALAAGGAGYWAGRDGPDLAVFDAARIDLPALVSTFRTHLGIGSPAAPGATKPASSGPIVYYRDPDGKPFYSLEPKQPRTDEAIALSGSNELCSRLCAISKPPPLQVPVEEITLPVP